MPEDAGARLTSRRHIADVPHQSGIFVRGVRHAAFYRVNDGSGRKVARQNIACMGVDIARGRAYLIVAVGVDIFHEEIQNAGIALQYSEKLKGAVFRLYFGFRSRNRHGGWLHDQTKRGEHVARQCAAEKKRKKCAKSQYYSIQSREDSKI